VEPLVVGRAVADDGEQVHPGPGERLDEEPLVGEQHVPVEHLDVLPLGERDLVPHLHRHARVSGAAALGDAGDVRAAGDDAHRHGDERDSHHLS
jgi:hypothetical protein